MNPLAMNAVQAAALWTALNLIYLVILSLGVVKLRRAHRVGVGDGGVPALTGAGRAFGNAAEYVPAGLAAMAVMALAGAAAWAVHAVGALLLIGRLLHASGLTRTTGVSTGRLAGMALTYVAFAIAAVTLLLRAFAPY